MVSNSLVQYGQAYLTTFCAIFIPPLCVYVINRLKTLLTETAYSKKIEVQIFNSGSFFDETEIDLKTRAEIFSLVNNDPRILDLSVESRPEFITEEVLESASQNLNGKHLEIGIGLEYLL